MPTCALISEGVTDQVVLEFIIDAVFTRARFGKVDVNRLQPLRDASDAATAPYGGWELVLEYCRTSIQDALATNDFVVVQIDTDCGDHPKFGLNLTEGGG